MVGFTYFFLLECLLDSIKALILDFERDVFMKDLFFWGVSIFLNLHRYIYL